MFSKGIKKLKKQNIYVRVLLVYLFFILIQKSSFDLFLRIILVMSGDLGGGDICFSLNIYFLISFTIVSNGKINIVYTLF